MIGRKTRRLERLAAPLNPVRSPRYIRRPAPVGFEEIFPVEGWYWIPEGHAEPVFLASSGEHATHKLLTMIEAALPRPERAPTQLRPPGQLTSGKHPQP